jgi:hypothetical protein
MTISLGDISVEFLLNYGAISKRAYHVCFDGRLKTLKDLKEYFKKNKNFKSIKGCGVKTNRELVKFSKSKFIPSEYGKSIEPLILDSYQFENKIRELFKESLGVRAQKPLLEHLADNFSIENIENRIVNQDFSTLKFKQVGVKTMAEIEAFVKEVVLLFSKVPKG